VVAARVEAVPAASAAAPNSSLRRSSIDTASPETDEIIATVA
jgi:hypothetical protein